MNRIGVNHSLFLFILTACCWFSPADPQIGSGAEPGDATGRKKADARSKAITAGEFAVAKTLPPASVAGARDAWLAQVATAQSLSGEITGAASTVRQMNSPSHRQAVIDRARGQAQGVPAQVSSEQGGQAAGGGAFADFDSLMNLIETTVVPDTWEALGGNSTMAPYPQGVFVDASGTVEVSTSKSALRESARGSLGNLETLLTGDARSSNRNWRDPAGLRCVSLRRLRDEITTRRLNGNRLGDEVLNLAGLSQIQYLILTEDDIILAAPVGGIDSDRGWYIDRETGRTPMRSDFLARCLASALSDTPFGCTIDPTPSGMQAAMKVAADIRSGNVPIGKSAESLKTALGHQRVEVFGAAGDTAVALLMVEADRHMKQLALGKHPMPDGIGNYLDAVEDHIAQGPPNGLLLRLWFTAKTQSVRCDHEQRVFELSGMPIRLSGENQRALADGGRGDVTVDPRSEAFVEEFNRHWNRIRDEYPVYGSLESLYRVAAAAQLIKRYGSDDAHRPLASALAMEDDSRDWNLSAPRQVESIATLHNIRSGKKRHHVLLASGGVSVETKSTVAPSPSSYPTLGGQMFVTKSIPTTVNRWWWDAK